VDDQRKGLRGLLRASTRDETDVSSRDRLRAIALILIAGATAAFSNGTWADTVGVGCPHCGGTDLTAGGWSVALLVLAVLAVVGLGAAYWLRRPVTPGVVSLCLMLAMVALAVVGSIVAYDDADRLRSVRDNMAVVSQGSAAIACILIPTLGALWSAGACLGVKRVPRPGSQSEPRRPGPPGPAQPI